MSVTVEVGDGGTITVDVDDHAAGGVDAETARAMAAEATKLVRGATSGIANLAALPAASAHTAEVVKTDDGGVYESTGTAWVELVPPSGTYVPAADLDELVDDRVANLLIAGTNVTLTYDDVAGTLTIDVAGGTGGGLTQEQAEDIVAALIDDNADLDWTYDDTAASLVAVVKPNAVTFSKFQQIATGHILGRATAATGDVESLTAAQVRTIINVEDGATADMTAAEILAALVTVDGAGSGLDADLLDGVSSAGFDAAGAAAAAQAAAVQRSNHTGTQTASTISDLTESVQDVVGAFLADSTVIDVTYDDAGNTETITIKPGVVTEAMLAFAVATQAELDAVAATVPTTESMQDLVAALLVAGANVTLTYDDPGGTLTVAVTDEAIQDVVGGLLADSAELDVTYDDVGNTATIAIKTGSVALSKLATDPLARSNHTGTQTASTVSDFSEAVDDRVAALLVAGSGVTLTYNDAANTLTIAAIAGGVVALTDGATIATDASLGNIFKVTLGGNRTLANPTNPTAGQKIIYRIKQDATGSRTATWATAFRFGADVTTPTLTTTASKTDYIGFIYNADDSKWDCLAVAKGY